MDEKERAELNKTIADTDAVYLDRGVLSPAEIRNRLAHDVNNDYDSIDPDDVPDNEFDNITDIDDEDKAGEVFDSSPRQDKIDYVMNEFKEGRLKSSDGKLVTDKDQALAIAYSEAEKLAKDEWDENKHPRDKDGKFSNGSGQKSSIEKSERKDKIRRGSAVVNLRKDEFATVQHSFMSDVNEEDRKRKSLRKAIGDYIYTGVLREDGTRDITYKRKIK